ncbi:S8 family peptidase [Planktothrix agardhii]|uniref:Cell wall-associated protease n=3 Tax=Planktothrix TaxID=54304 RepID=A0AAD1Q5F5_PLAAG|nr:PatA/PatG family cyanobactin maturation protease [Planktothrix agardhii]MCF3571995.1 PatA/PatG family cyanobactin maturation protease [Planktothrix agardhii 1805]MCF3585112.1 PatA/PatG family cyanobactin maturation protease [Planktothrix agardhii 1803]MCF3601793.1 PatA/PatG family cyanobactin maturation protease [Planktothrix agardhii 1804]MCF3617298.1 PatA/PatG family cyanobactin maturation protease [Planktothrix agardhii 1806]CAD5952064.1 Cell wall-associated protease [Planktothrix agardh
MTNIPGLKKLWTETRGDPKICVAVLDGIVDQNHPCFDGADLTRLPSLVSGEASENGSMSTHGTHVASIIFGQHDSPVTGIAPQCRGLIIPVFADESLRLSQLDLSRAIEQAVNNGANIINVSAGQLTDAGEADTWLEKAIQLCQEKNVLLIAATGNDGCECLHVPASLPTVLAVGAMDDQGKPVDFSNWGDAYQKQGILAPGKDILGAKPGGGTVKLSGTSFATPIVSGVAALLLSLQIKRGEKPDPQKVKTALLATATPCNPKDTDDQSRCLMGKLNILDAIEYLTGETMSEDLELESVEASGCGCQDTQINESELDNQLETASEIKPDEIVASVTTQTPINIPSFPQQTTNQPTMSNRTSNFVTASEAPSELEGKNLVYALGVLGYDFGSEARRDSFKQLMPGVSIEGTTIPANPYDARQMVDYLGENLPEAKALIWTLNLELTPIYAIEPVGGFSRDVYEVLQGLLSGQIQEENSPEFVQRVSIPGVLTGRSVKLFSGQVVPVIEINNTRGLYGWKVNSLVSAAIESVQSEAGDAQEDAIRRTLSSFLNRIYYDLRNLGTTSQDRALNFASTNAFQAAQTFAQAVGAGYELDSITVEKSPFCRLDSDCWDVKLKFFDPENSRRAKKIYRFTIDVSDTIPVTLGEVRSWSSAY